MAIKSAAFAHELAGENSWEITGSTAGMLPLHTAKVA
jgi:hypothetical protein